MQTKANKRKLVMLGGAFAVGAVAHAQVNVNTSLTPQQLVQDVLVGSCVTVSNVTFNGSASAAASAGAASFTSGTTNLGIANGVILASGNATGAAGASTSFASTALGTGSDADLVTLSGQTINDRTVLEFDFVPQGDSVRFRYVFGSEEYPEFVCSNFNDAFGFFLSGPGINGPFSNGAINLAVVPNTIIPITINTINSGQPGGSYPASGCATSDPNWQANSVYYVDNATGTTVAYDGFTVVLTAKAQVQCGQTYHIKLAIGDGFDSIYDSGVFLEAGSFSSVPFVPQIAANPSVQNNTIFESCYPLDMQIVRTSCDLSTTETVSLAFSGTATMGVDIQPAFPTQLVFQPNQTAIPVSFNVPVDGDGPETWILSLTAVDCNGNLNTTDFTFYLQPPPPLFITGGQATIPCLGSATLTPVISGGYAPYALSWPGGLQGPSVTVSPTANTTYPVTVTDDCGTTATAQFFVELEPLAPLAMGLLGPNTVMEACESTQVNVIRPFGTLGDVPLTFTFSGQAANGTDFNWSTTAVIPDDVFNIVLPFQPLEDGVGDDGETVTITATYTDACGRSVSASVTITIVDAPAISVTAEDYLIACQPDSMLITATGFGGVGGLAYSWSTGDTGPTALVTMLVPGNYTITVTDQCGRTAQDVAIVTVECDVTIPNVFTPNSDGQNDRFVIDGILYVSNNLRVFNRWGQEVYAASNYKNQWDGGDLPDGTYYYELTVARKDKPYTGHLTILRNGWR
jgi:gliding motility-associated-like protein